SEKNDKDEFVHPVEARKLAYKISNYGYYTQYYLESIHSEVKIGEGGYQEMNHYTEEDIDVEEAVTKLEDTFVNPTETANYVLYGRTVYFEYTTALNYYVIVKNGKALTSEMVECDKGKKVEVSLYKDNIYIVSIKDIKATELNEAYTVNIGNELEITSSVLDYCGAIVNEHKQKDTEKDKSAIRAMAAFYEYYVASMNYANSLDK
ncbi:MAG: hypothetical protein MJ066_03570, partial [Clostridia bacterium]|nr:hypothetical protein [Clostridia bacterium]